MTTPSLIKTLSLSLFAMATIASTKPAVLAQTAPPAPKPAAVSSISPQELVGFDGYPLAVKQVIEQALALTKQNLTYTFASSDPASGGMDCSGTIYHLLQTYGLKDTPRQSDEICLWVRDKGTIHLTANTTSLDDAAYASLRPGDLIFWTGTYATSERKLPISHVMMYLGKHKESGRHLVFGASDGRRYAGQSRCGVSVFDLELPKPGSKAALYGYGRVPGLEKEEVRKP